jgi:MFS family permease
VIRLLAQTCGAASATFTDAITLGLINKYGGKDNQRLGLNRFWHVIGSSLGAPISGALIDLFSNGDEKKRNFLPGFIINGIAALICAVIISLMEVTTATKPKKVMKNVGALLKKPPFFVFILSVIMIGMQIFLANKDSSDFFASGITDYFRSFESYFFLSENFFRLRPNQAMHISCGKTG